MCDTSSSDSDSLDYTSEEEEFSIPDDLKLNPYR